MNIGKGLFEAAKEKNVLDRVYDEIGSIKTCFTENPAFLRTLCSPFLSVQERISILNTVFGDFVHLFVLNSLKILYENKTQCSFEIFASSFLEEYEKKKGILRVKAYSATPMSEEEAKLLKQSLKRKTGKIVKLQLFIDKKLIGGLKYEYDNMIFDGGVSGSLLRLKEKIAASPFRELDKGVD